MTTCHPWLCAKNQAPIAVQAHKVVVTHRESVGHRETMLIAAHLMGLQEPFATAKDLRALVLRVLGRELGHELHRAHDNEMVPELVRPEPLFAALTWAWDAALVASERSAAAFDCTLAFSVQTLQFREQFACCILDRFPWCAPPNSTYACKKLVLVRPEDDRCAV